MNKQIWNSVKTSLTKTKLAIWIVMFNVDACCSCDKCVYCSLCQWNIFFLLFFNLCWQIYNIFPWMGKWIKTLKLLKNNVEVQANNFRDLIDQLKTSLNPEMCRCLIDSFLIRKQKDEVKKSLAHVKIKQSYVILSHNVKHESFISCLFSTWTQDSCVTDSLYHEENLLKVVSNLFAAGTDTTGTTLRWALLLMAKYPQIQCKKDIHPCTEECPVGECVTCCVTLIL
jgi:hypothetical protein